MIRSVFLCVALALSALPAIAEGDLRHVTVAGEGSVKAVPDMASIRVGIVEREGSAQDAMAAVSEAATALLAELQAQEIAGRDMQTGALRLSPIYDTNTNGRDRTRVVAFEASVSLDLRLRDLNRLGPILDVLLERGANELRNLSLDVQEPAPLVEAARRAAVEDAMARAALYAEAAGLSLGPIQSITEAGAATESMMMARAAPMDAASLPLAPGEISVTARVNMIVELTD